jgi:hypothetical protein
MKHAVRVAPHIFRQYDIRGVVGEDLDEGVAARMERSSAKRSAGRSRAPSWGRTTARARPRWAPR